MKGTTQLSAVALRTRWGRLRAPLGLISFVKLGNDRDATAVALAGGDKLYGVTVEAAKMTVKTAVGEVAVSMDKITRLYAGRGLRPGQSVRFLGPDNLTGKCKTIRSVGVVYDGEKDIYQFWILALGGERYGGYYISYEIYYGEFQDLVAPKVRNLRVGRRGRHTRREIVGPATLTVIRDRLTKKYHIWAHSRYRSVPRREIRHFTSDDGVKWTGGPNAHTASRGENYESPVAVQLSDGTVRLYYRHQTRDGQPWYFARSDIAPKADKPGPRTDTSMQTTWLRGAVAFTDRHHRVWYDGPSYADTFDGGKTWSKPAPPAQGPYSQAALAGVFFSKQSDAAILIYYGKDGSLMFAADSTPVRR